MAERSNAHDSKSCDAGMYPRVQISFSAPQKGTEFVRSFFSCPIGRALKGERRMMRTGAGRKKAKKAQKGAKSAKTGTVFAPRKKKYAEGRKRLKDSIDECRKMEYNKSIFITGQHLQTVCGASGAGGRGGAKFRRTMSANVHAWAANMATMSAKSPSASRVRRRAAKGTMSAATFRHTMSAPSPHAGLA